MKVKGQTLVYTIVISRDKEPPVPIEMQEKLPESLTILFGAFPQSCLGG
jgi:hypothetical protein